MIMVMLILMLMMMVGEGLVDVDVGAVPVGAVALNVLADAENADIDAVYLPEPGCHCGSGDPSVPDVGVSRKC